MKILGILRLKDGPEWSWEMEGKWRKFDTSKEPLPTEVLIDLAMETNETGYEIVADATRHLKENME
jgi:hypothetical protein